MAAKSSTTSDQAPATTGLSAYRALMRTSGAPVIALASLLARLPYGMASVGLVLFLHEETGSFSAAGVVTGAYVVGLGLTGPVLARVIDRRGSGGVLLAGGLTASLALVLVFILGRAGAGAGILAATAAVSGGASPPVGSVVRRRWAGLVAAERLPTAYALESILVEVVFIAGPALAGLLTGLSNAGDALLVAAGLGAVGTIWFSALARTPATREGGIERHWAGALRSPTVRLLIATGVPMGAAVGALDIALPAFGAAHGHAALGGPYAAAFAAGSLLGGIAYGARPRLVGSPRRALVVLAAAQGVCCVPILLVGGVGAMFAAAALAGVCWAPLIAVRSGLVQARVEAAQVTEAFTWDGVSETVGASLAAALTGPLVAAQGWRAGAVLGCILPLVGATVALVGLAAAHRARRSHDDGLSPAARE